MSTHPNAILMAVLKPDGLSRKTMREILAEGTAGDAENSLMISGEDYHAVVMEDAYDICWQISAEEGDLVFLDLVTYGYGEKIAWADLERRKAALEEWARATSERHNCAFEIFVGANYW